jgi:hypothetical protein
MMTRLFIPVAWAALILAGCTDQPRLPVEPLDGAGAAFAKAPAVLDHEDYEYTIFRHPEAVTRTWLMRVNTNGVAVGEYLKDGRIDGFRARGEAFERISVEGSIRTSAMGINPRGDVVGTYRVETLTNDTVERAYIFSDGRYRTLPAPADYQTRAFDIAPNGVIAGSYHTGTGKWQPAIWEKGEFKPLVTIMQDLGADMAEGFGINVHGQVVGHFTKPGITGPASPNQKMFGFIYDQGQVPETLNYPGSGWMSCSWGIGVHGDAVGHYVDIETEAVAVSGYVWRDGAYTGRLIVPGAIGTYPQTITPNGTIAGYALLGERVGTGYTWNQAVGFIAVQKRPGRR